MRHSHYAWLYIGESFMKLTSAGFFVNALLAVMAALTLAHCASGGSAKDSKPPVGQVQANKAGAETKPEKSSTELPQAQEKSQEKPPEKLAEKLPEKPPEKLPREILQEMTAREFSGLAMHGVSGPLSFNVLSSAAGFSENLEGASRISIPMGAQTPVECTLNEGSQSPAYTLQNFLGIIRSKMNYDKVMIKDTSAGVLGKIPYLYLETEYLEKGGQYGVVKTISLSSIGFVLTCFHDELGYQKTFFRVAESLAGSALIESMLARISHFSSRHINVVKINNRPSGVMENFVFDTDGKTVNYYSITNVLVQVGPAQLNVGESVDDVTIEKKSGYVTQGKYLSNRNDTEEYRINLLAVEPKTYKINGLYNGKQVDQTLNVNSGIMHFEYVVGKFFSDVKNRGTKEFKFTEYLAGDPLKTFESKIFTKFVEKNLINLRYVSEKATMNIDVDASGIFRVNLGSVLIERVFVQ